MKFDNEFGHALEIFDCFLDIFASFDKEIVDGLRRGYGGLYGFEELTGIIPCIVFNYINYVSHSRLH